MEFQMNGISMNSYESVIWHSISRDSECISSIMVARTGPDKLHGPVRGPDFLVQIFLVRSLVRIFWSRSLRYAKKLQQIVIYFCFFLMHSDYINVLVRWISFLILISRANRLLLKSSLSFTISHVGIKTIAGTENFKIETILFSTKIAFIGFYFYVVHFEKNWGDSYSATFAT